MPDIEISQELRSEKAHGEMLLRQYPWMKELLQADEIPQAVSFQNADLFHGIIIVFLGIFCVVSPVLRLKGYGPLPAMLLILAGIALIWLGIWLICFRKRGYMIVTQRRVLHRKINLFGRDGKLLEIDRRSIVRVRFLKSTVMYRIGRADGAIAITLDQNKTIVIPDLRDGEKTFSSLR